MPKATQVLAALKRDGWIETRRRGSHRRLQKGGRLRTWAFHDSMDLGSVQMAQIARQFGYSLEELRAALIGPCLWSWWETRMRLRVEYHYDPESRNWSFVVPSLGIVGGADSRQQAAERAIEAIEFTLEGENEASPLGGEVEYLQVTVKTA